MRNESGKQSNYQGNATTRLVPPLQNSIDNYAQSSPKPIEPNLLARATELRNYVLDAAGESERLRRMLFRCDGPEHCPQPAMDGSAGLDEILADACQRAAMLLGELRTINGKTGG